MEQKEELMNHPFSWEFLSTRVYRAEGYLREDDIVGASALAAAVVETALRRACERFKIPSSPKRKCSQCGRTTGGELTLASLARALRKEGIFDRPTFEKILKVRQIRNRAAHGYFGEISRRDCQFLISSAEDIVAWGEKYIH